jgi:hypothetical protein
MQSFKKSVFLKFETFFKKEKKRVRACRWASLRACPCKLKKLEKGVLKVLKSKKIWTKSEKAHAEANVLACRRGDRVSKKVWK